MSVDITEENCQPEVAIAIAALGIAAGAETINIERGLVSVSIGDHGRVLAWDVEVTGITAATAMKIGAHREQAERLTEADRRRGPRS